MTLVTLAAASLVTSPGQAGPSVHGLYPIDGGGALMHFIDMDSRQRYGGRYVYTQVSVLRREDVDAMPIHGDANKQRTKLRSIKPVRVEHWGADCATDTVRVQEFAGNLPTGTYSGWLSPQLGSISYSVMTYLCPAHTKIPLKPSATIVRHGHNGRKQQQLAARDP